MIGELGKVGEGGEMRRGVVGEGVEGGGGGVDEVKL